MFATDHCGCLMKTKGRVVLHDLRVRIMVSLIDFDDFFAAIIFLIYDQ